MSTIIHIVVDATLSAGWWVIRRASYGIYSGTHYLIWGKTETSDEIREKKIMSEIEDIKRAQENILSEIKNKSDSVFFNVNALKKHDQSIVKLKF